MEIDISVAVKFSASSIAIWGSMLREACDWLYSGYISFSGRMAIPMLRESSRQNILSNYSREEISKMLSCIDNTTSSEKLTYSVVGLLFYLKTRVQNIDWETGESGYIQQKTGMPFFLPVLDEVKYPLIDYIKNARKQSMNKDFIFAILHAPFTRYHKTDHLFRK